MVRVLTMTTNDATAVLTLDEAGVERLAFQMEGAMLDSLWEAWLDGRPANFRKYAYQVLAETVITALREQQP